MTEEKKLYAVGNTGAFDVLVPDGRKVMALQFDFVQYEGDTETTTPIQVVAETDVMMALLANLQEIKRIFDIPMPDLEGFSLKREQE